MLIENPQLEADFLLAAEPHTALAYLYERANSFSWDDRSFMRKSWSPSEGLVARLINRGEKAIDVGLLYAVSDGMDACFGADH
jgi:hypothetical protein